MDHFVIASSALWAGDFVQFEKSLRAFQKEAQSARRSSLELDYDDNLLLEEAGRRLNQFKQRKREFAKLVRGFDVAIESSPHVLTTRRLSGALWSRGAREFHLQAYLTDLKFQSSLLKRSHVLAEKERRTVEVGSDSSAQSEILGGSWIEISDMFMQIDVTDLGLIEARGIWIQPLLPQGVEAIVAPFQSLLDRLDVEVQATPDDDKP